MSMEALDNLRAHLIGAYFYQGWAEFEGTPEDIGRRFAEDNPASIVNRTGGDLQALLHAPLGEEEFRKTLKWLGMDYSGVSHGSHREVLEACYSAMMALAGKRVAAAIATRS